ncbi:MAG: uncharacterized membrane protein (UPF0127 family) [Halobacteriales archaeon]|jgi:uncharacterized membrane protein (UPF0127 family)
MRVVHDPGAGDPRPLATDVGIADSVLSRGRGLMFRRSMPEDYALVFEFGRVGRRNVHMVFVPFPIDVLWLENATVVAVERLSPWTGLATHRADTLIELPAGAADGVEEGDDVRVEP